jgi:hypothetical protein
MSEQPFPEEFHIDTAEGRPLDPQEEGEQLDQLLALRDTLAQLSRNGYRRAAEAEAQVKAGQRQNLALLQVAVGVVDELRRLVGDAGSRLGAGAPGAEDARAWLGAFDKLVAHATARLEALDVHRVPLLGEDLRGLAFEGQPVKGWVSVLNRPDGEPPVIREESQGLWVLRQGGQLLLVQRGEAKV